MSKRQSMLPAAPPTPIHFISSSGDGRGTGSTVILADAIAMTGTFPVSIASDTVVHPRSRLDARRGPINLGRRCIIDERAILGGEGATSALPAASASSVPASPLDAGRDQRLPTVTLGDYVSVETGAQIESGATVGTGCIVGARCIVGQHAVVGEYCTLAPRVIVPPGTRVPDFTVLLGNGQRRRDQRPAAIESRQRQQVRRIEVLRKLIPNMRDKYRS